MSQAFLALSAQTDLLEAWSYIADQSVDAADHVLDVIDKEAQTLALQPLMGKARPDLTQTSVIGQRLPPTTFTTPCLHWA